MIQSFTTVNLNTIKLKKKIDSNSKLITLGSCFANEIGKKFSSYKYQTLINPFGKIYNPLSLLEVIKASLSKNFNPTILNYDNYYLAYEFHSSIYAETKDEYIFLLHHLGDIFCNQLSNATHIFITLGTAWVYKLVDTQQIVSCCHKQPATLFEKEILDHNIIYKSLIELVELIEKINPTIEIFFTVSPVRHIKDGLFENNVSKGRLLDALYRLTHLKPHILYLPVYEIIIDELRDYRFYEEDLIHPNQKAVNYIWEKIKPILFDSKELEWIAFKNEIDQALQHKPIFPKSKSYKNFLHNLLNKIQSSAFHTKLEDEKKIILDLLNE